MSSCSERPRTCAATPGPTWSGSPAGRRAAVCGGPLAGAAAIVDAILGTGFSGEPRDPAARRHRRDQRAAAGEAVVIACDVPSGVDASTGEVVGAAVLAAATGDVSRRQARAVDLPGKAHAGEVQVIDIGIPPGAPVGRRIGLIEPACPVTHPAPRPGFDEVRRRGRRRLRRIGRADRRAEHGLRVGDAGRRRLCHRAHPGVAEPGFRGAAAGGDVGPAPGRRRVAVARRRSTPSWNGQSGRTRSCSAPASAATDSTFELARAVAGRAEVPLLLDADGLNAHAGRLESLAGRSAPTVLTPHAGELARLLGCDSSEVDAHRLAAPGGRPRAPRRSSSSRVTTRSSPPRTAGSA